jgi:putative addiction module component (TIGR02574 family)
MSKAEILKTLPSLTLEERNEILLKITELDSDLWFDHDDPLTDEDKALIEARIDAHERNPEEAIPWNDFKARLTEDDTTADGKNELTIRSATLSRPGCGTGGGRR